MVVSCKQNPLSSFKIPFFWMKHSWCINAGACKTLLNCRHSVHSESAFLLTTFQPPLSRVKECSDSLMMTCLKTMHVSYLHLWLLKIFFYHFYRLRGSSLDLRICTGVQLRWRTFGFLHQPKRKHVQRCPKLRWQYLRHSSSSLRLRGPASWRWLGLHPASQTTRFSREAALAICITRVRSCILPGTQKSSALSRPRCLCSHLPKIPLCW